MRAPRSSEIDEGVTFVAHAFVEGSRGEDSLELQNIPQCPIDASLTFTESAITSDSSVAVGGGGGGSGTVG